MSDGHRIANVLQRSPKYSVYRRQNNPETILMLPGFNPYPTNVENRVNS